MKSSLLSRGGDYIADIARPSALGFTHQESPAGPLISLHSEHGLCYQGFHNTPKEALHEYQRFIPWPLTLSHEVFKPNDRLHLVGSAFQIQVWRQLYCLSSGEAVHYSDFAARCHRPTAVRSIASAIAKNPIAIIIPCHRVVPKSGGVGQYRWGADIKRTLLALESD